MQKINVIVVFGGRSVEHDISIITGVQVLNNLDKSKFNIFPVYLSKQGEFFYSKNFYDIKTFTQKNFTYKKDCKNVFFKGNAIYSKKGIFSKKITDFKFAFLATHGACGENGSLQGLFELIRVPYSSCGVLQSAIGMNKYLTKVFLQSKNLPYVDCFTIQEDEKLDLSYLNKTGLPVVVKPCSLGSSVGISFCKTKSQVKNAVSFAKMFDNCVVVEKAIENLQEVNIAVLGNEFKQEFSDIEEVLKTDDILSFENKYLADNSSKGMENTKRILPAKLDEKLKSTIEDISTKVFKQLKCKGVIRFDFLINKETKEVFLNELNTIPGSFANYLWKTKKYDFKTLLNKIYDYCLESFNSQEQKLISFSSSVLNNISFGSGSKINKLK